MADTVIVLSLLISPLCKIDDTVISLSFKLLKSDCLNRIISSSSKPKVFRLSFPPFDVILPILLDKACPITSFSSFLTVPSTLKLRSPLSSIVYFQVQH